MANTDETQDVFTFSGREGEDDDAEEVGAVTPTSPAMVPRPTMRVTTQTASQQSAEKGKGKRMKDKEDDSSDDQDYVQEEEEEDPEEMESGEEEEVESQD